MSTIPESSGSTTTHPRMLRRSRTTLWSALAFAAILLPAAGMAKDVGDFDTLELGPITGISPFEIDADVCTGINCDVNGEAFGVTTDDQGWDFTKFNTDPPDASAPYGPDTENNPPRFTGITDSFQQKIDGGNGGCQVPETPVTDPGDTSIMPGGSKQDDNPWNAPLLGTVNNKTDICVYYSAFEYVRVVEEPGPPYAFDQQALILYIGVRPLPDATGDRSYSMPLFDQPFGPALRTGGEKMLDWDVDPGGGTTMKLMEWDNVNDEWDQIGIAGDLDNTLIDCEFECLDGTCDDPNDTVSFAECAINLTAIATTIPDNDKCFEVGIPDIVSRTGEGASAALKDVVQRTPKRTGTCGEVLIDKVYYGNDTSIQRQFPYELSQADGAPSEDLTTNNLTPPFQDLNQPQNLFNITPMAPLPPFGDLSAITSDFIIAAGGVWTNQSDHWENVISEPDYVLMELLPLPSSTDRLWTIKCSYYDIFANPPARVGPVTVYADPFQQGKPAQGPNGVVNPSPALAEVTPFGVATIPFMGITDTATLRTECTIENYDNTIPITLGSFQASSTGSGVSFSWSTVTETGHLGFNLFVESDDGKWVKINDELIPPLVEGDSFQVREYSYEADGVAGKMFAISDVSALSGERKHGPFKLDEFYGLKRDARPATNWEGIRAKHDVKKKARKEKGRKKFKLKLQKSNASGDDKVSLRDVDRPGLLQRITDTLLGVLVGTAHAAAEPVGDPGLLYIDVTTSGLQRVTYAQFAAAGYDLVDAKARKLGLAHHGESVPIYVKTVKNAEGKNSFGSGAYIEFIADEFDSLYTDTDSYALYVDGSYKLRIAADKTPPPAGRAITVYQQADVFEEDAAHPEKIYATSAPNGDPWYAAQLRSLGKAVSVELELPVDNYVSGEGPVSLEVGLWGMTLNRHSGSISLNGSEVVPISFLGLEAVSLGDDDIQPSQLQNGDNSVTLNNPGKPGVNDVTIVDSWSITYPRRMVARDDRLSFAVSEGNKYVVKGFTNRSIQVYRTDDDGSVKRLTRVRKRLTGDGSSNKAIFAGSGESAVYHLSTVAAMPEVEIREVAAQDDLLNGNAEYLVIAHPDFIDAAMDDLTGARAAQYGSVKVASTEAVYAQFGGGVFGAQPISDYIKWAADNLGTTTVLLVGSDVSDYLDRKETGSMSFLPSIYTRTGALIYHAPSDAKYADIDDDDVPDLSIGRLIPRNADEWRLMVDKTLAYGSDTSIAMKSVFAADNYDTFLVRSFSNDSDALVGVLPESWQPGVTKAYMDDDTETTTAHTTLMDALNGGVALASYVGHSGPNDWARGGLLTADKRDSEDDVAGLTNTSPFVVTQWGCWNTYYVSPYENSMAHEFLRNGDSDRLGGAAAVLGATALTGVNSEISMGRALYGVMFETGKPLGEAVLEAKQALPPGALDVILGWNLIGDPGLMMAP